MRCPLCTQSLDGGELVMVCRPCHQSMGASLEVSTTGEFRVAPSQVMSPDEEVSERVTSGGSCSWCGKIEPEVRKLLGRGAVALCDECISLACDILDAELGHWR
jgi:ClpX C4-type zinc finger